MEKPLPPIVHPLRRWMDRNEKSEQEVAALVSRLGGHVSTGHLKNIMSGYRHPSRALAKLLARATGENVTFAEFMSFDRGSSAASDAA